MKQLGNHAKDRMFFGNAEDKVERIMKKKVFALRIVFLLVLSFLLGAGCLQNSAQAASDYLVKINKQANCVTIYKLNAKGKYKPVKAMVCSTGYATKEGSFTLGEKIRWHVLDGPCYGQYCTRIYGSVLFHSVWYSGQNDPSTLSIYSYNKLGTTASHGCVRLTVEDAKWIYDNVPSGTRVVIYSDSNPGPLGKPKAIKLPYTYAWDPTDTGNPNNPWNDKKPSITGVKNRTVQYNSDFNIMKGVKAKNTTGFNAKDLVTTEITYQNKKVSKVDTKTPGTYKVKYILIDEIGRKATAKAKIKVTAPKEKPVISGVEDIYVKAKNKLTKSFLLKNVTVKQGGKKLPAKYITVKVKKIKKNVYRITYTAKRASVPTVVEAKAYVDSEAPVIQGITDGSTYQMDASVLIDENSARGLIQSVSDNFSNVEIADVAIAITTLEENVKYQAVYTLKDQAGNEKIVTVYLLMVEFVKIEGPAELSLKFEDLSVSEDATAMQIRNALTVYLLDKAGYKAITSELRDVTAEIMLELTEKENDAYTALLTVGDGAGHVAALEVQITLTKSENNTDVTDGEQNTEAPEEEVQEGGESVLN